MKKAFLAISMAPSGVALHAQVKIGSNPGTIDQSSVLELQASDKAFYMSRVSLASTADVTTVLAPKAGMMVYNTNALLTGAGAKGAGVYYFNGTGWISANGIGTNSLFVVDSAWLLTGNNGTIDGTNFMGTLDAAPLNFRVNNVKAGRIENGNTFLTGQYGNVAIGYNSQSANTPASNGAGSFNTSMGNLALTGNTSGRANTATGYNALAANTTGDSNTVAGAQAGTNNITGSNNTFLGFNAGSSGSLRRTTAIGSQAVVTVNNGLVLGAADASSSTISSSNVGINVTDPTQRIDFRNGHIRNRQDVLPTIGFPLVAGNGVTGASVAAGESDVRGTINTVGYNNANGLTIIRLNFQSASTNAPIVTITPANESASTTSWYVTSDVNGFSLSYRNRYSASNASGPSASFNYMVLE